jgi:hypothetical protein
MADNYLKKQFKKKDVHMNVNIKKEIFGKKMVENGLLKMV